jgi:hypothetical protein
MKSILKSLLIIAIMAAFLEACLYFSPTENSNALENKPAPSASAFHNHQINYMNGNSRIDSQSVSSGKYNKWLFIRKKADRT